VDADAVLALIADLREEGSDTTSVEVKTAAGGMPGDLSRTISAFANTPGGGTVILGVDERSGFAVRGVYDAAQAQAALASMARQALEPPILVEVTSSVVEGSVVVVARVGEAPASLKPVRVKSSGKAYLRGYDGDYEMSKLEEQAFIANRDHPRFDQQAAAGATFDDLDSALLANYTETCRSSSSALAGFSRNELLLRTGVTTPEGGVTVAGLLALGKYPQQFLPNVVVQASVAPRPGDPPGTRASDVRKFDGPLPLIMDELTRWVQRNTRTRVRFGEDGHGRDEPEYPVEAVRELISNALVHRDLGPHAMPYAVSVVLESNQLVISNPGGLWGITVDRLGRERVSSARNDRLLRIAQNVRTIDGRRVVEAIASGIPTVLDSLAKAGMVPPAFHDQGIRFTVRVPNHALLAEEDLDWLAEVARDHALSDTQRHALVAMRHGRRWTNSAFRVDFPRDSTQARSDLQGLVEAGLAVAEGDRGGRTYSIAPDLDERGADRELDLFEGLDDVEPDRPIERLPVDRSAGNRSANAARLLELLASGPKSAADLMAGSGLSRRQVLYALEFLRESQDVVLLGRRGVHASVYTLAKTPER
jgi:ATP-dependent DNA helicase RecG